MLYFIVNPIAGNGKGAKMEARLIEILKKETLDFSISRTEYAGHAVELARELSSRADCMGIAAVGGDGTFYEVLNGMNIDISVGLIPCGTGNDFAAGAAEIVGDDPAEIVRAMASGKTRQLDYISVGGKRCLNIVGTGFDVDVLNKERRIRKVIKSKLSYYIGLILTLIFFKFRRLHALIDDKVRIDEQIFLFTAANGKYFGGGMPIAKYSSADDGMMDIIVIRRVPRLKIPGMFIQFLKGNIQEQKQYVDVYRCKKCVCDVEGEKHMNIDGEVVSVLPAEIEIKSGVLSVFSLVPRGEREAAGV